MVSPSPGGEGRGEGERYTNFIQMKITEIRTRVVQWKGKTVPLPPHFCTNPMDVISPMLTRATMRTFTFHG